MNSENGNSTTFFYSRLGIPYDDVVISKSGSFLSKRIYIRDGYKPVMVRDCEKFLKSGDIILK